MMAAAGLGAHLRQHIRQFYTERWKPERGACMCRVQPLCNQPYTPCVCRAEPAAAGSLDALAGWHPAVCACLHTTSDDQESRLDSPAPAPACLPASADFNVKQMFGELPPRLRVAVARQRQEQAIDQLQLLPPNLTAKQQLLARKAVAAASAPAMLQAGQLLSEAAYEEVTDAVAGLWAGMPAPLKQGPFCYLLDEGAEGWWGGAFAQLVCMGAGQCHAWPTASCMHATAAAGADLTRCAPCMPLLLPRAGCVCLS